MTPPHRPDVPGDPGDEAKDGHNSFAAPDFSPPIVDYPEDQPPQPWGHPPAAFPPPPPYPGAPPYPPPPPPYPGAPPGWVPPYPLGYPPYGPPPRPETSGMAITSLTISGLSIVFGPLLAWALIGFAMPIIGVALGAAALGQIQRTGQGGRGLAIAGIVVGAGVLCLLIAGVVLFFFAATHPHYDLLTGGFDAMVSRRPVG